MPYYQILKQRRLDLNLSVQDVAIQTQLAPQFIRAIEDNNLEVFSDDYSYVRAFIQAYCQAIGVKWEAIAPEVDSYLQALYNQRMEEITREQEMLEQTRRLEAQKAEEIGKRANRKKKKAPAKKKKRKLVSHSAKRISTAVNWSGRSRLSRTLIILAVAALLVLMGLSYLIESRNSSTMAALEAQKQQELQQKEKETQQLADQLKNQKIQDGDIPEPKVKKNPDADNFFYVANAFSSTAKLEIGGNLASESRLVISKNGQEIYKSTINGLFSDPVDCSEPCSIDITINQWNPQDTISLNSIAIPVETSKLKEGEKAVIHLEFVEQLPETKKETRSDDAGATTDENAENPDGQDEMDPNAENMDEYGYDENGYIDGEEQYQYEDESAQ